MRIAHLVESYSPLSETFIYDIVSELSKDHDNVVFTMNIVESERDLGKVVPLNSKRDLIDHLIYFAHRIVKNEQKLLFMNLERYLEDFKKQLEFIKPDVLVCHFGPLGILASSIAKPLQIPVICIFYGYDMSRLLRYRFWVNHYEKVIPSFKYVVGISGHICKKLEKYQTDSSKVKRIHLGVDQEKCKNTYPADRIKDHKVRCLFIGRLVDKKSPLDLIKVFQIVLEKHESDFDLELLMVGDGPLRSICDAYIERNQLSQSIKMLGKVPHSQIFELISSSHIYIQHSVTAPDGDEEGQGVTLVEASAMGLPVVVTDHNGFSDVILDGVTGFLTPEKDLEAMAFKIIDLIRNPAKWSQLGENGVNHIKTNFNRAIEVKKLIDLLK